MFTKKPHTFFYSAIIGRSKPFPYKNHCRFALQASGSSSFIIFSTPAVRRAPHPSRLRRDVLFQKGGKVKGKCLSQQRYTVSWGHESSRFALLEKKRPLSRSMRCAFRRDIRSKFSRSALSLSHLAVTGQNVKSSATHFRQKIKRRQKTKAFSRARVNQMNNILKFLFGYI